MANGRIELPKTLLAPALPINLSKRAQWLAGEGAGSWFTLSEAKAKGNYFVSRFSPEGKLECAGTFISENDLLLKTAFAFTFPTHCTKVTLVQENKIIMLKRI